MKKSIKCFILALAVILCTSVFSGCAFFPLMFLGRCDGCIDKPSSLQALRGADWLSFSDEGNRLGFRITEGSYFGGYGYITVNGERQQAFYDLNGYYGYIDVYALDEEDNKSLLFTFGAEYEKGKGIKIKSVRRSASDENYKDVMLNMTAVTDKSAVMPYEYVGNSADADNNFSLSNDLFGRVTCLTGRVTVVTAERDRTAEIKIYFRQDFTFEICETKNSASTVENAGKISVAFGTFAKVEGKDKSYCLHFTQDNLFTEEIARSQFSAYPDITLTVK